jgi:hypothetical protein
MQAQIAFHHHRLTTYTCHLQPLVISQVSGTRAATGRYLDFNTHARIGQAG